MGCQTSRDPHSLTTQRTSNCLAESFSGGRAASPPEDAVFSQSRLASVLQSPALDSKNRVVQLRCLSPGSLTVIDESAPVSSSLPWRWISASLFFCYTQFVRSRIDPPPVIFIDARTKESDGSTRDVSTVYPSWAVPVDDIVSSAPHREDYLKKWLSFRTLLIFGDAKEQSGCLDQKTQVFLKWLQRSSIAAKLVYVLDGGFDSFLHEWQGRYAFWLNDPCTPGPRNPPMVQQRSCPAQYTPKAALENPYPVFFEVIPPSTSGSHQSTPDQQTYCWHSAGTFALMISPNHPPLKTCFPAATSGRPAFSSGNLEPNTIVTALDTLNITVIVDLITDQTVSTAAERPLSYQRSLSSLRKKSSSNKKMSRTKTLHILQPLFRLSTTLTDHPGLRILHPAALVELVCRCSSLIHDTALNKKGILLLDDTQGVLAAFVAVWFLLEAGDTLAAATQQVQRKCIHSLNIPAEWQQILHTFASLLARGCTVLAARVQILRDIPMINRENSSERPTVSPNAEQLENIAPEPTDSPTNDLTAALQKMKSEMCEEEFRTAIRVIRVLLRNVISHPEDPKYRTVRLTNPKFHAAAGSFPTALKFLQLAGWVLDTEAGTLVLSSSVPDDAIERVALMLMDSNG